MRLADAGGIWGVGAEQRSDRARPTFGKARCAAESKTDCRGARAEAGVPGRGATITWMASDGAWAQLPVEV